MSGGNSVTEPKREVDWRLIRTRLEKLLFDRGEGDARWAMVIGLSLSVLYGLLAWRLSRGHFFSYYNLLFDFDPPSYVNLFSSWAGDASQVDIARAIKHPLASWLSLFSLPFRLFGLAPLSAVILANVCVGGTTAALLFGFARTVGAPRLEALLVTLIFGLGASQLFSSMIVESYSYAALSLALVWYLAAKRIVGHKKGLGPAAIATYILVFGITITNVAQAAIAEFFAQWSQRNFGKAFRNSVIAGAAVAVLFLLAIAATWPQAISYASAHPLAAAKEIYWQQTYGPRTGLGQILLTFFGFSLAAPHFDKIVLPEGIVMRDFRTLDISAVTTGGMILWNMLVVTCIVAALRVQRTRMIAAALLSALIFNVGMHTRVQFRGSLFIYTPNFWFVITALVALGIAALQSSRYRIGWYLKAGLVTVLVTVAPANIARAIEASELFDRPNDFLTVSHNAQSSGAIDTKLKATK